MSDRRQCFNCTQTARPGHLTCEACERAAVILRETPGTLPHAIAHLNDGDAQVTRGEVDR